MQRVVTLGTGAGVVALVSLLLAATHARAEVVDLQWRDEGRFEHSLVIAPERFAEVCGPLAAGQTVRWTFKADKTVNFNIHYHVGKAVQFPVKKEQVESLEGDLVVDSMQDYCWMWSNKTTAATKLSVTLDRR